MNNVINIMAAVCSISLVDYGRSAEEYELAREKIGARK